jgi:hypothetical protein
MHFLKYEDLVSDTEREMKKVLNFLQLPVESNCFETKENNAEASKHPLWQNINKPVLKTNFGKYGDVVTPKDLIIIESVGKHVMHKLGYTFFTKADWKLKNPYFFLLNEKLKERASRRKHRNFLQKDMKVLLEKEKVLKQIFAKFKS